jgi:hypothetical protein
MSEPQAPKNESCEWDYADPRPKFLTMDVLPAMGFQRESDGSLRFRWDRLDISAHFGCKPWPPLPIVRLIGTCETAISSGWIGDDIAPGAETTDEVIAWVVFCIDKAAQGKYEPVRPLWWLEVGRKAIHLLPWNRPPKPYDGPPYMTCASPPVWECWLGRDWAKVAVKSLRAHLNTCNADEPVSFSFDGTMLVIRVCGCIIPTPARGSAWESSFTIAAGCLKEFPKRMKPEVHLFVWGSTLNMDKLRYKPVTEHKAEVIT